MRRRDEWNPGSELTPFHFHPELDWADYTIINRLIPVAVPGGTDDQVIRNIQAGICAPFLGLKSLDHTLNTYIPERVISKRGRSTTQRLLQRVVLESRKFIFQASDRYLAIKDKPDRVGLVLAGCSLYRLRTTFHVIGTLIKMGLRFESETLLRLALEQIGWALAAHEISDDAFLKLTHANGLVRLKHYFPHSGRIYGILSKAAHVMPDVMSSFVRPDKRRDDVEVITVDISATLPTSLFLLHITDYYCSTIAFIARDLAPQTCFVRRGNAWRLNPERSHLPILRALERDIRKEIVRGIA